MSIITYFKETRIEMKHVTWPTPKQAMVYAAIVIIASIFVALFLGFFDYLFSLLIQKLIYQI